jgi:antirestriction protein ArdC
LASRRRPATTTQWPKVLKDDKQSIFAAASHAQKADDYLHALQPRAAAPTEAEDRQEAA